MRKRCEVRSSAIKAMILSIVTLLCAVLINHAAQTHQLDAGFYQGVEAVGILALIYGL